MRNIKESDMYYPLLLVLKSYQGKATKPEIADTRSMVMRIPKECWEKALGFKTVET